VHAPGVMCDGGLSHGPWREGALEILGDFEPRKEFFAKIVIESLRKEGNYGGFYDDLENQTHSD